MATSARERHLRRTYDLSLHDYDLILAHQDGGCAICHRPPGAKALAVDHCHKTGAVRGLLCNWCNRGLRYYRDKPENFERAAKYLWRYPAVAALGRTVVAPAKKKRRRRRVVRRLRLVAAA